MAKTQEEKRRERVDKAVERLRKRKRKIEEWMYGGHVYNKVSSTARVPGVPTRNYIEERRLSETLYEIGKKRFEYMSLYDSERFRFYEKQKRKSSAVRRRLVNDSDILSRGWTVGDRSLGREDTSQDLSAIRRPTPRENTDIQASKENSETQIQNLEPETLVGKLKEVKLTPNLLKEHTGQSSKGKTVQFSVFQTEVPLSREPTKPSRLVSKSPTLDHFPALLREKSKTMSMIIPWGKMKSTSIQPGTHLPPLMSDPRYRKLEKLLCPVYVSRKMKDISEVVKTYRALHEPPDHIRVSRLQREHQIKQFMKERGLVF